MNSQLINIQEEERQMILIALAHLAIERPGWNDALSRIALKMDNQLPDGRPEMFEKFKELRS